MDRKTFYTRVILVALLIIMGITVSVFVASYFGIRVVYDPTLEIDWDATSASIDLIGVMIVPIALLLLQRKWDIDKQDIANSNHATIKELESFKQEYEELLLSLKNGVVTLDGGDAGGWSSGKTDEERIIQYITVNMGATRYELSTKLDIPMARIGHVLGQLKQAGRVQVIGHGRSLKYKISG